ncbi:MULTISPECIES: hypothetical protein [unclassified Desulfovibrio]|uniref:hypothetical protein n=1 Tax=unclassified Desulfovibrio TaxID=2593640 RepID=UPI002FD98026
MSAKGINIYNIFILHAKLFFLNRTHLQKIRDACLVRHEAGTSANAAAELAAAMFFKKFMRGNICCKTILKIEN